MKQLQSAIKKVFERPLQYHLLFIIAFLALFCIPVVLSNLPAVKLLRAFVFGSFLLVCMYSGRFCSKQWLFTSRFQQFILYSGTMITGLVLSGVLGLMLLTGNKLVPAIITVLVFVAGFFSLGVFLTVTKTSLTRQIKEAQIRNEQKENELQLLKSQLSPHFLFNILNSLYGLSLMQDPKVPSLLLKLSDLLRYSVYETNKALVPLQNELINIENYLELERIRMGERLCLSTAIQKQDIQTLMVAPMLLIVFVENAFKHAKNTALKTVDIYIRTAINDGVLEFLVKNSISKENEKAAEAGEPGIGLAVTLKRLELLYKDKFTLEQSASDNFYQVMLKLQLK